MTALPRRPPWRSLWRSCSTPSSPTVELIRAVIVPSASMRATSVSPCGDNSGFALDALFVGREDRRDQAAAGLDEFGVGPDGVRAADQIQDRVDAAGVSRAQRAGHVDGLAVVDFRGAEATSLVGVAADGRDDVRTAGQRHLHRVAADPAGRAHHHQALARGDAQQVHRPERRYRRGRQGGGLFVGDTVGDGRQRLGLRARRDRGVFGERAVRARHAEHAVADVQVVSSRRNPFDDAREVDAQHNGICRAGRQAGEVVEIERIDPCVSHPKEKCTVHSRDRQVVDRRSLAETPDSECAHMPPRSSGPSRATLPRLALVRSPLHYAAPCPRTHPDTGDSIMA